MKRGETSASGAPGESALPRVWSVTEISRELERRLKGLGRVSIEGEVSQMKLAGSGHLYFGLKDLDAYLSCAIWKSRVPTALRFRLEEGMRVVCHGELDVYKPRGSYSLIVERVEARGTGDLLARFEALKQELKTRGWFDRKRALPPFPSTIGLVTSRDGAALHDFLRTRSLRWPGYPVRIAHSSVQGASAALEIADAIRRLDQSGVDLIVLIRGGGSIEDLWCFNELAVAEAIFATRAPVVSGVGHETDFTLADFVADRRAHTPTDAAQTVIPDRGAILVALERAQAYLAAAIDGALDARGEKLAAVGRSPVLRSPEWIFVQRARELDRLGERAHFLLQGRLERAHARLESAAARASSASPREAFLARVKAAAMLGLRLAGSVERAQEKARSRLELASARLEAIQPLAVLSRGYSITRRRGDGKILTSSSTVLPGEAIETLLASGALHSRVDRVLPPDEERGGGA